MPSPESNSKLITHKPYHMLPCIYLQCRAYVNSSNNETSLPQQAMPLFFISYATPTKNSTSSLHVIILYIGLLLINPSAITPLHNLQGAPYSPSRPDHSRASLSSYSVHQTAAWFPCSVLHCPILSSKSFLKALSACPSAKLTFVTFFRPS